MEWGKNNKSIVSGSEPTEKGLPADPLCGAQRLCWAFSCPPPSSAGSTLPSLGCQWKGILSRQLWLQVLLHLQEVGLCVWRC